MDISTINARLATMKARHDPAKTIYQLHPPGAPDYHLIHLMNSVAPLFSQKIFIHTRKNVNGQEVAHTDVELLAILVRDMIPELGPATQ